MEPDAAAVARFTRILKPRLRKPLTPMEAVCAYLRIVRLRSPVSIAAELDRDYGTIHAHLTHVRWKLGRPGYGAFDEIIAEYHYATGRASAR